MAQHSILSITIPDKETLYNAYMPFVINGGLFVPTLRNFGLGDEVFVLLTLSDIEERLPIPGKVMWITPQGAQGNRKAGIGMQFSDTPDGSHARTVIESHLAGLLNRDKRTYTL
ncbi:MAG: PilZ domain-containing protein [Wenzhouxiangellaceae bacterium]